MNGAMAWQRNPALAWREIDEETVIISPSDSVMHELNETGSFIWKSIDGQRSAEELARMVAETYEVRADVALADTQELLEQLASRKLVAPASVPAGNAEERKMR